MKKNQTRPIVCGTDFSALAREAADIAAAIAIRREAPLVLVHVHGLFRSLASNRVILGAAISERRRALTSEAQRLRNLGARVDEKFVSGSAFDKLVKAAARSHARLIVVGAVGQRLARRLLVGSVAERTAETSPVPTLVVRPGGRLLSWIRGRHRLKVLAGYDFSAASDAALGWVNQLRELGKLQTSVLYSSWPPDEARRLGGAARLPLPVNPEQIQENLDRDLRQRVAKFFPGEKAATIVEPGWGNPEGHLFEMASREHVDLLVVGTRRRRGAGRFLLGSVSRAVLHHAKMSVAVIPANTAARKSAA